MMSSGTIPFADLLRGFRGRAELTQEELAEHAGISPDAVAPNLFSAHEAATLAAFEDERPNLRAALQWSLDHGEVGMAARFGVALWQFWGVHTHLSEGRVWLEAVLTCIDQA